MHERPCGGDIKASTLALKRKYARGQLSRITRDARSKHMYLYIHLNVNKTSVLESYRSCWQLHRQAFLHSITASLHRQRVEKWANRILRMVLEDLRPFGIDVKALSGSLGTVFTPAVPVRVQWCVGGRGGNVAGISDCSIDFDSVLALTACRKRRF